MIDHRMKILALLLVVACAPAPQPVSGVVPEQSDLARRIQLLEDRAALKALVDTFSNLADQKDVARQLLLFTEDATVESRSGGAPGSVLRGREQIGQAFSSFLANFTTVYHMNGHQTVTVNGDRASGTAYCLVVLAGMQDGREMRLTMGVRYDDEYVRLDGKWLIAKRTSHFDWRDSSPVAAAR